MYLRVPFYFVKYVKEFFYLVLTLDILTNEYFTKNSRLNNIPQRRFGLKVFCRWFGSWLALAWIEMMNCVGYSIFFVWHNWITLCIILLSSLFANWNHFNNLDFFRVSLQKTSFTFIVMMPFTSVNKISRRFYKHTLSWWLPNTISSRRAIFLYIFYTTPIRRLIK